jgi:FkbM family methyltransferase
VTKSHSPANSHARPTEFTIEGTLHAHSTFLAALESGEPARAAIAGAYGWDLELIDDGMALAQIDQIVIRRLNDFVAATEEPRIIDCGANIGISVLNYKLRYPGARIVAFEPDRDIHEVLQRNLAKNGAAEVETVQAAVWTRAGYAPFVSNGTDGGRIATASRSHNAVSVPTVDLNAYLTEPVDLLKLDIEGGEYLVVPHIAERLHLVKNLIVECHIKQESITPFAELLAELRRREFSVCFDTFGHWRDLVRQPKVRRLYSEQYVGVYAYRTPPKMADAPSSCVPYLELSVLRDFYRAHESHGGPRHYQATTAARLSRHRQPKTYELSQLFHQHGGRCWTVSVPAEVPEGDTPLDPRRSRLMVFEDGTPLGPPHCEHAIIGKYGGGRYSHWHNALYFSTSDDSDPNSNGRTYAVAIEPDLELEDETDRERAPEPQPQSQLEPEREHGQGPEPGRASVATDVETKS